MRGRLWWCSEGNSTKICTLMFTPRPPSKFSLPNLCAFACCLRFYAVTYAVSLWLVLDRYSNPRHPQFLTRSLTSNLFSPHVCLLKISDPEQSPWRQLLSTCFAKWGSWALRHAKINDRETFTGLVETASEMKEISSDLGIDVSTGGMPHRRELAKVTTAWKRAKAQADVKEQTEAPQSNTVRGPCCFPRIGQASWSNSRPSAGTT